MYSDNGTNFTGSRKELAALQLVLDSQFGVEAMPDMARHLGSTWSTIPPGAPHWGGLWEAAVKSAKTHFKKSIGQRVLTYEEMTTIFVQI